MLTIDKIAEGKKLTIKLEGRLDTPTAPMLEKELKRDIGEVEDLVFDFEKLDYVSSAGLRVLLAAHKVMERQGKMTVRNVNDGINDIFELTGFVDILNIE
ncbi:MAG: STAS domain-containing protein [Clostridiales bacterium]|nr:STAS domain-containing protein [Clostridiales bacterium]MCD8223412.1 STAS domain-containing protein [Clostridiales bacterium]